MPRTPFNLSPDHLFRPLPSAVISACGAIATAGFLWFFPHSLGPRGALFGPLLTIGFLTFACYFAIVCHLDALRSDMITLLFQIRQTHGVASMHHHTPVPPSIEPADGVWELEEIDEADREPLPFITEH